VEISRLCYEFGFILNGVGSHWGVLRRGMLNRTCISRRFLWRVSRRAGKMEAGEQKAIELEPK
jgi:hypothetical protein